MGFLKEVNIGSCGLRLLLALILGGVLGFTREKKGRPAGLRTYMIVCVSSALVMITNQYIMSLYDNVDVSRMGAQVLSGIGFLGAGTIIVTGRNKVKGLTTAAGLWAAACLGLAVGIGFYYGAILGCAFIFIVMEGMHRIDNSVCMHAKIFSLYIEFDTIKNLSNFLCCMQNENVKISDLEIKNTGEIEEKDIAAIVTLNFTEKINHSDMLRKITGMDGILFVEEA